MGLVDGFAKGIALGNDIRRTDMAEEDARLRRLRAEKDSSFQEWQRDYTKRQAADNDTIDRLEAIRYGIDKGLVPNEEDILFINDNLDLTDQVTRSLFDDNSRKDQARAVDILARRFAGENIPKTELLGAGNTLYGDQVGEGKSLADFFISPDGEGMVFSLNVDGVEGKLPMTEYRLTEEDGDNKVKVIPFADMASDLQKRNLLIRGIDAVRVKLGDKTPIIAASEQAAAEQERISKAQIEQDKQAFELNKMTQEYGLKTALEKTKARLKTGENGGKGSNSGPVKLDSNTYKQFNATLMDGIIQRYGLQQSDFVMEDELGNVRVDEDRFFNSLPEEGKDAWLQARQLGEQFMRDGNYAPVNAAMTALQNVLGAAPVAPRTLESYPPDELFTKLEAKDPEAVAAFAAAKPEVRQKILADMEERERGLATAGGNYGQRTDGTPKGEGWLGKLKAADGNVMTEKSISIDFGQGEMLIPLLVPTLTEVEIQQLADGNEPTKDMVDKAVAHARQQLAANKSPFKGGAQPQPAAKRPSLQNGVSRAGFSGNFEAPERSTTGDRRAWYEKGADWLENNFGQSSEQSAVEFLAQPVAGKSTQEKEAYIQGLIKEGRVSKDVIAALRAYLFAED